MRENTKIIGFCLERERESEVLLHVTEDLAVDWVSNKLYWIDALWARIEVMDIATGQRTELIRTSNHSIPRGIAVDPISRSAQHISPNS